MWYLYTALSAICASATNILRKKETELETDDGINFATFLFAIPFYAILIFFFGLPQFQPGYLYILLLHALIDFFSFHMMIRAIRADDISLVSPFFSFSAVFSIFLSWFLLGQVVSVGGTIGILLCVMGVFILSMSRSTHTLIGQIKKMQEHPGILYAVGVAIAWSLSAQVFKIGIDMSSVWFHPLAHAVLLSIAYGVRLRVWEKARLLKEVKGNIKAHVAMGAFFAGNFTLHGLAYSAGIVPYVLALKRSSLLLDVLAGGVLLKERNLQQRLLGASVIVVGVIVIIFLG